MNSLPEVSEKLAPKYEYFPTMWQAVVWRNWGYIPVSRIAEVLHTDEGTIREAAELMGLNPEQPIDAEWEKRGFLTVIRNNWNICTYEQIITLLNITAEELAFILKEDDFMWIKLGGMKTTVTPPKYDPLTEEQEKRTLRIAELLKDRFPAGKGRHEHAFAFIADFNKIPQESSTCQKNVNEGNLRMVYPYFALYGDALIDESIDPLPEGLLQEYAKMGITGIWMQMVLYQLVEFPFEPSISKGWEKRIETLRKLTARAKKYGIGIYPYLNEPRSMPDSFFQKHPEWRGQQEGDYYAMCTSVPEVQEYLYQSVRKLFEMVPDLAGFFTITMSENLTNCYSRVAEDEIACPRCKERKPWEVVAEVNNIMAKAAHDVNPSAKVVNWAWGWADAWAEKVVPLLTENQIVQCTSEEAMEFNIGGVEGRVIDYTMSLCGPGEKAKGVWKVAKECGIQTSAKVQLNNTWEMSVVPYIPVFDKVETHINNLKACGVQHLQASWTLGGGPTPNLKLAAWLMDGKGTAYDFLVDWLGEELAEVADKVQKKLSSAFSNYPFYIGTLYYGPQNFGPMAPFFLQKTGYRATMVGYPYDDIEWWSGIYGAEIYEKQYQKLCIEWREGVELLEEYEGRSPELDEMLLMARAVLAHYESAYHHIQFVRLRGESIDNIDKATKKTMLDIVHDEMKVVQTLIELRLQDSRIGFESSNQYFYTLQDLKEKMINLAYCEEGLQ